MFARTYPRTFRRTYTRTFGVCSTTPVLTLRAKSLRVQGSLDQSVQVQVQFLASYAASATAAASGESGLGLDDFLREKDS